MQFGYDRALITQRRLGTDDSPYVNKDETHIVNDQGKVILSEIPNKFNGVVVEGGGIQWYEIKTGTPNAKEFKVNYDQSRIVTFDKNNIGKQLNFSYKGEGLVYVNASAVFTEQDNGDVVQTLKNIIDNGKDGIEALNNLDNFEFKGKYDMDVSYKKWNFVLYEGKTYVALNDVKRETPSTSQKWMYLTGQYYQGVFNSKTTYYKGDMVSDQKQHNIYISLVDKNDRDLSDVDKWVKFISIDDLVNRFNNKVNEVDTFLSKSKDQELTRQNNEDTRIKQENTRQDHEATRKSQEQSRQQAHNQRMEAVDNFKYIGNYDKNTKYKANNMVFYDEQIYLAAKDVSGEPPDNSNKWIQATSSLDWQGIFDNKVKYQAGNVVADANEHNLYISLVENNDKPLNHSNWKNVITIDGLVNNADDKIKSMKDLTGTVQKNEDSRKSSERDRQKAEDDRQSNESSRKSAESSRDNAEQTRSSNEDNRKAAETKRSDAESTRSKNEDKRKSSEDTRSSNEQSRKTNEDSRQKSEASRGNAEDNRVKAEKEREKQESTRQSQHDKRMNEVDDAIDTTLLNYLEPVKTFDDIKNTYTSPSIGDVVELTDSSVAGEQYRWNGKKWKHIATRDTSKLEQIKVDKSGDTMNGGLTFGNIKIVWNNDLGSLDFVDVT